MLIKKKKGGLVVEWKGWRGSGGGGGGGEGGEEEPKEVTYAAFAFLMSSSVSTG